MKKIMKKKGFSVVEILIVVLIGAIVVALAIPGLKRSRVNANESYAKEVLKQIGTAFEEYSRNNNGRYPLSIANLTTGTPRYLEKDYTAAPSQGYTFSCINSMIDNSYSCTARPIAGLNSSTTPTGTKNFIITAGLTLTEDDAITSPVGSSSPGNNTTNGTFQGANEGLIF